MASSQPVVEETWVQVMDSSTNVISLGNSPQSPKERLEGTRVILIVPGNPGLASFYEEFMLVLQREISEEPLSIWAVSHIGHEQKSPSYLPIERTYTLEEQVEHKLALIDLLLPPSARITLIGHSIGCRMLIDIVQRNTTHNFEKVYFLFPTLENMISTPQGAPTWSLCATWRRPLLLTLLTILNLVLPDALLRFVLSLSMPRSPDVFIRAAARWRNPNYLNNCLMMAKDELETVLDLDSQRLDTLTSMGGRLRAYYGATDHWSPLSFRSQLLENLPSLKEEQLEVCDRGIAHAFVETSGTEVAQIVASWEKQR